MSNNKTTFPPRTPDPATPAAPNGQAPPALAPPRAKLTRAEFIKAWQARLAGLALCGLVSELRESPMQRGARALDIPADVRKLLEEMYDDLIGRTA
jgi:hypothetical protein